MTQDWACPAPRRLGGFQTCSELSHLVWFMRITTLMERNDFLKLKIFLKTTWDIFLRAILTFYIRRWPVEPLLSSLRSARSGSQSPGFTPWCPRSRRRTWERSTRVRMSWDDSTHCPKLFKRQSCQGVDAQELKFFCSGAPLEVRIWILLSTGCLCICIHDQGECRFFGFLAFPSLQDY